MSGFDDELTITQLADRFGQFRLWRLHEPLVYEDGGKRGRKIVVPAKFITDGPTIPRFLWAVLPVWGSWGRAGVLHDYLCARIATGRPHPVAKTRLQADRAFLRAMKSLGVGRCIRLTLYVGVRLGTWTGVRPNTVDYNTDLLKKQSQHEGG